jgi:hypothetical protein
LRLKGLEGVGEIRENRVVDRNRRRLGLEREESWLKKKS